MSGFFTSDDGREPGLARPRRLSLYAFAMLGAGFMLARSAPGVFSTTWLAAASAALIAALLARGTLCRLSLCAAILLGGAGWFAIRINERAADSLWRLMDADPLAEPQTVRLRGMIEGAPTEERPLAGDRQNPGGRAGRAGATVFDLCIYEAGELAAGGRVRVYLEGLGALPEAGPLGQRPMLAAGAFIEATGVLRPVVAPLNPGEPARDLLAAQEDRVGTLIVPDPLLIGARPPPTALARARGEWASLLARLHSAAERSLGSGEPRNATPGERAGEGGRALVRAMLMGERDPATAEVESTFRRIGLVHLVAISGFNMAVLASVTLLLLRLTGDRGWVEPALAGVAVLLYMLVLPGEASIRRSGITLLVFMVAEAAGRRYDRLTLLGWVALALLLVRPMDLWSLGFQLSFGIVAALIWLGHRVHERLWGIEVRGLVPTPRQRTLWWGAGSWLVRFIKAQVSASLLAWAIASPLIAHHTGLLSPIAPLASLVVLPATVVLMGVGYAAMLLGLVIPGAGAASGWLLARVGEFTIALVERVDEWPGACITMPRLGAAWTIVATACIVYWLGWGRLRDARAWALTLVAGAMLALAFTLDLRPARTEALRIDVLAMGDGSCQLVRAGRGGGGAMLIDCGSASAHPSAEAVRRAVRELGGWRVPTVLITDSRPEAWSLVSDLIEPLAVRTVLLPQALADQARRNPAGAAAALLDHCRERGVNLRVLVGGDRFTLGEGVVVSISGKPGPSDAGEALVPRIEIQTRAGERSVFLGSSAAGLDGPPFAGAGVHADVLFLPRAAKAADHPAATARGLGSAVVVHSGTPAQTRLLLPRMAGLATPVRTTATGAVTVRIGQDGSLR